MGKRFQVVAYVLFCLSASSAQSNETNSLLLQLMKREPGHFQYFIDHKTKLEIQIIYTQINRDANNMPVFKSYSFYADSSRYFYPASTVKLPMVLLAFEKLHQLNIPGLDKFTSMMNDSVYSGQSTVTRDSTSDNGFPSIAHYARKILVASDNDAYNRLYEFMGQQQANELLRQKGYSIRLLHRLDRALTPDENRHTESIRFLKKDSLLYYQPMLVGDSISVKETILKGVAYYKNDTLIPHPFNFSYKNFFSLAEQQRTLRAILFPSTLEAKYRFAISDDDRKFILKYMSQLPDETNCPAYYTDSTYYPAYSKFLMFGEDKDPIPPNLRIFNKVGDAYGYLIDNAYIVDFEHHVEFMLSAVIHANTDGIYNDGEYEYKTLGYPFMKHLGQLIYKYELKRKRLHKPDLSEFKFEYERN